MNRSQTPAQTPAQTTSAYHAQVCVHCTRTRDSHPFLGITDPTGYPCTWLYDALTSTYDQAQDRYTAGLWSIDQWQAYERLHVHTAHRRYPAHTPETAALTEALQARTEHAKAKLPDWKPAA